MTRTVKSTIRLNNAKSMHGELALDIQPLFLSLQTKGIGQTESVDSNPCKWAVWLRKRGGAEIFILQASSPETKETWINAIKECHHSKKRAGLLKS